MDPQRLTRLAPLLLLAGLTLACGKDEPNEPGKAEKTEKAEPAEAKQPATTDAAEATPPAPTDQGATDLVRAMLGWLPNEALAVSVDRVAPAQRFDPAVLAVVFGLPPKAADLLEDRRTLDEALGLVFDGDAKAETWLGPQSLAFTVPLAKKPYFVRPLLRPVAEVEPLLEQAGFTRNDIEGVGVWLPSGAFPWRIAVLDEQLVAFIPIEIAGAGLEPLLAAAKAEPASVETQVADALGKDPFIELTLLASGPLLHFDVDQPINQVQFALRRATPKGDSWEGQIVLTPSGDPVAASQELRERSHPEENQQVQALLKKVDFLAEGPVVIGRLLIGPDELKHFRPR